MAYKPEVVLNTWLSQWAPKTQRSYAGALAGLRSFLHSKDAVPDVSEMQATRFLAHLRTKDLSPWTIQQRFFILSSIYRSMVRQRVSLSNPFEMIADTLPKSKPGMVKPHKCLPFAKVKELLAIQFPATPDGLRDKIILVLLFGCALRASEAMALNCDDVVFEKNCVSLRLRKTKAQVPQESVVPKWGVTAFIAYKQSMLKYQAWGPGSPLIPNLRIDGTVSGRLAYASLSAIFKKLLLSVGLSGFTPHDARATVITKMLTDGCNYREVQEVSRHSSITMVEIYDKRKFDRANHPSKKISFE